MNYIDTIRQLLVESLRLEAITNQREIILPLEEAVKTHYPNAEVDLQLDWRTGQLNVYPHIEKIPWWQNYVSYQFGTTIFVFRCVRHGIVDGDYDLCNGIIESNIVRALEKEEIAKLWTDNLELIQNDKLCKIQETKT